MKVIDLQAEQEEHSPTLLDRLPGGGRRGLTEEQAAQERVVEALGNTLSNQYVLYKNVNLESLEIPVPLVLIGPPGIRVLAVSSLRGVYRAQGETWEKLDDRQNKYRPALPNLIQQGLLFGSTLGAFIKNRNPSLPTVETVLVFTDPGMHLESARPAVRIVMTDAIERFINGLIQSPILLSQEEVAKAVELLSRPQPVEANLMSEDAFDLVEQKEPKKPGASDRLRSASENAILPRLEKVPFTNRQWMILGVIILINILLLVAFLVLVLSSS